MQSERPPTSDNVKKVIETLEKDPDLVKELNQVLAKAYDKAEVTLTQGEKADLFSLIACFIRMGMKRVRT